MAFRICSICKNPKECHLNRITNKFVCTSCVSLKRYHDVNTHEKCVLCGNIRHVIARTKSGDPICPNCYAKDSSLHEVCSVCARKRRVSVRTDLGIVICKPCNQNSYTKDPTKFEVCWVCEKLRSVHIRTKNEKPICKHCYVFGMSGKCANCQEYKIIQAIGLCCRCYKRHRQILKVNPA